MGGCRVFSFVLLLCFALECLATTLTLQFYLNAKERDAVCNDGTPAGFYFAEGSGSGVDTWIIHQQGGWFCWDEATCLPRAKESPSLVSSKGWGSKQNLGGLYDDDSEKSPTFYNANKVMLGYCSSDVWSGTRKPNGTLGLDSWSFQGSNHIKAAIEDLAGMGMNNSATKILWTGCSAGGNGVIINVDYARSLLTFTPERFLALSDAGWHSDFHIKETPFFDQFRIGHPLWQGEVNKHCMLGNPFAPFICYFGGVTLAYIETPMLVHIEQYDIVQFGIDCACSFNGSNALDMANMEGLRSSIANSILVVRSPHSVFSPACAYHCTTLDNSFSTITVGGVTLAQHLAKFWEGSAPNIIDTCTKFNCSQHCPPS